MNRYELLYIIKSNLTDEAKDQVIAKVNDFIVKMGGNVESTENLGNKKLAYEINKTREGTYVLTYFNAEPNKITDLDRMMRIDETIIRQMIVTKKIINKE